MITTTGRVNYEQVFPMRLQGLHLPPPTERADTVIEFIDTLTGTACPWCKGPIGPGFAVHEMAPDEWVVICVDCDLVTEVGEGK